MGGTGASIMPWQWPECARQESLTTEPLGVKLNLFDWTPFPTTKAAVKMHTLLDLRGAVVGFIHIIDDKMGDVNALGLLNVETGNFYVMDRGYLDFKRLYKLLHRRWLRDSALLRCSLE